MLFQHDPSEPVGVWLEMKEDLRGLWARGRLIPDVTRARELLALLQAGAVDGLSIGYRTQRGQIEPKTRVRKLYQVDLWEVSIVTFPLLNGARVSAVKDAPRSRLRDQAERDWTQLTGQHVIDSYRTDLSGAADAPALVIRRGRKAGGPRPGLFAARPRRSQTRAARRRRLRPVRRALRTTRRAAMRAQNSLLIVAVIAWVWVRAAAVPTMVPWLVVPPVPFGLVNGLA